MPRSNFERLVENSGLEHELLWEEDSASLMPERVEILVTVTKKVDRRILDKYPALRIVTVAFTGYDSVDLDLCRERGIQVYNVPSYATHSVAELVLGLTISLLRDIPAADQGLRAGQWDSSPGLELHGRTVGILGTGRTGQAVAKIFKALGCNVIGWSRTENEGFKAMGGTYIRDKREFFATPDIVSVHLPLTEETRGFIGKEEFLAMKPTAYLVNTARGAIVREADLIEALESGSIAGAGLDVFEKEPMDRENRLAKLPQVTITPHIAFKTREALERRAETTVANMVNGIKGNSANRVA